MVRHEIAPICFDENVNELNFSQANLKEFAWPLSLWSAADCLRLPPKRHTWVMNTKAPAQRHGLSMAVALQDCGGKEQC